MNPLGLCTQAQKIAGRTERHWRGRVLMVLTDLTVPWSFSEHTYRGKTVQLHPCIPQPRAELSWANLSLLARVCTWEEYERRSPNGLEGTDDAGKPCVQYPPCPRPLLAVEDLAPCRLGHRDSSCWESSDSLFLVLPGEFGEFLAIPFFSRLRRLDDL